MIGEGAGTLILEEYDHAIKRGAPIYAEIVGGGMSSDAYHVTAPHPDGIGASLAISNTLKNANILPSAINYINTHGTSTPVETSQNYLLFPEHLENHIKMYT